MLIEYKTILKGEKPEIFGKEKNFMPNDVSKYEVIKYNFCCKNMELCIENKRHFYFSGLWCEPVLYMNVPDGYGDGNDEKVSRCPFCEKKIKCKEVKRVRYKAVKKEIEDYIEEEIKS